MVPEEAQELFLIELANISGFDISSDRFELIIPQLEWILNEAKEIDSMSLDGIEPLVSITAILTKK